MQSPAEGSPAPQQTSITQDSAWLKKIAGSPRCYRLAVLAAFLWQAWWWRDLGQVIRGQGQRLPVWSNFSELVKDGLKVFAVFLLWELPILLLTVFMMTLLMAVTNQSEGIINLVALGNLCTWTLALGYNLLLMVLGPSAGGILADTRSLAQALNPLNACGIAAANPYGYLGEEIKMALIFVAVVFVAIITCGIGVHPFLAYAYAMMGRWFGLAYLKALGNTAATEALAS